MAWVAKHDTADFKAIHNEKGMLFGHARLPQKTFHVHHIHPLIKFRPSLIPKKLNFHQITLLQSATKRSHLIAPLHHVYILPNRLTVDFFIATVPMGKQIEQEKNFGQVFTPQYLVEDILDFADYGGAVILQRHAIDNSCGDGAFLVEMVRRYCVAWRSAHSESENEELVRQLATFIHGIEKDEASHVACMELLLPV